MTEVNEEPGPKLPPDGGQASQIGGTGFPDL